MKQETFLLAATKTFRQSITIFIKKADGKYEKRMCHFTTEHNVKETERTTRARKINASFLTSDPILIDSMYRDTGYGVTFYHKDDPEGKRKKPSYKITVFDARKAALKNVFENMGLPFDDTKDVEVLNAELQIYVQNKTGIDSTKSTATTIEHKPVDVIGNIDSVVASAKEKYETETGESWPVFKTRGDELAFTDGLSNPDFDAKAFIEEKSAVEEGNDLPDDPEDLRNLYQQLYNTQVPNVKKNDIDWIKGKIQEKGE